mgnify:CR=1 FL=1
MMRSVNAVQMESAEPEQVAVMARPQYGTKLFCKECP